MKKQSAYSSLTHWLGVIIIGLTLGLILQFAKAWTEPTAAPPGGNVGAPLNTGDIYQKKDSGFTVNENGKADTNNFTYGINAFGKNVGAGGFGVRGIDSSTGAQGLLGYGDNGGAFVSPSGSNSAYLGTASGWAGWFNGGTYATGDVCTSLNGGKCLSQMVGQYPCECYTQLTYIVGGHTVEGFMNCGSGWTSRGFVRGAFNGNGSGSSGNLGFYPCRP